MRSRSKGSEEDGSFDIYGASRVEGLGSREELGTRIGNARETAQWKGREVRSLDPGHLTLDLLHRRFQRAWQRRHHFMSAGRHEHVVFDPNPSPARKIDAGFDSDNHPRVQHVVRHRRKPGLFVDLQPKPVAEAVAKIVAETFVGYELSGES